MTLLYMGLVYWLCDSSATAVFSQLNGRVATVTVMIISGVVLNYSGIYSHYCQGANNSYGKKKSHTIKMPQIIIIIILL